MFWQSVLNGLSVLLHWQTYLVAIMYIAITFLPLIAIMFAGEGNGSGINKGIFIIMLARPLLQSLAVFISVCILFPIMLGYSEEASWSLPWTLIMHGPGKVLLIIIIMLAISFVGGLLPILGRANAFIMFIMGGTALVILTQMLNAAKPELGISNVQIFPDYWTVIGIVIVSGISSWIGIFASVAVLMLLKVNEGVGQLIMMPVGSVFGFIPIFIYAAWIGIQISGHS